MRTSFAIASVAAVSALALVAGCGSSTGGSKSGGKKNLELIVGTANDDFYVTMECGAKQEAKKLGVNLKVTGPSDFTVALQKPLIDAAVATKPDALLVAPTDASALDPDLRQVQSNGSKLVFVDTASSDTSLGVSRISSNNLLGGKIAADNLAQQMGDKGTVAVISVQPGVSTTDARVQGFDAEMKAKFPNIKVLATQYDQDSATTAAGQIGADIQKAPDLGGVFAANVLTAQGVATGVKSAGKSGKVKVATFDADPEQMQALQAGTIQLAIAQDPALEGEDAVEQGVNALDGKKVTANIGTPLVAITPQNMNSPSVKPYVYVGACS
jgi:ribose transport system substrate-binding protein